MKHGNLGKEGYNRKSTGATWILVVIALMVTLLVAGCLGEKSPSKPVGEVSVKLYFLNPPELGQVSTLQFEVKPRRNASKATVSILVPDGLEVVEGNTSWNGKIAVNETVNFTLKIKPVRNGEFTIRGTIINNVSEQEHRMANWTELGGGNTARLQFNLGFIERKTDNESLREQARTNIQKNKSQANVNVK